MKKTIPLLMAGSMAGGAFLFSYLTNTNLSMHVSMKGTKKNNNMSM